VVGALHQGAEGYEMDLVTGAPRLVADNWSWDAIGPGVNTNASQVVWMGLASFVNEAPWLGSYVRSQADPPVRQPTYPDGLLHKHRTFWGGHCSSMGILALITSWAASPPKGA
jgi:hypothetical protein